MDSDVNLAAQLAAFRATHQPRAVSLAGTRWTYLVGGRGAETLLLLPGGPGIAEMAFPYICAFEPHVRVLAPSYPPDVGSLDRLLEGIAGLLRHERVERFHLIGASYSGLVAQFLLPAYAGRVQSLMIGDTGVPRRRRAHTLQAVVALIDRAPRLAIHALLGALLLLILGGNNPERRFWRSYLRGAIVAATPTELVNRAQVMIDMDRRGSPNPHIPLWNGPTLLIESLDDQLFSAGERAMLRARLPQAEIHSSHGHRHTTALTRAPDYIALMLTFLRRFL